jgi:hypothetical protein
LRASVRVQFLHSVFGRALRLVEADVLSLIQGYCQRTLLLLNPDDMKEAGIRVFEKSVSSQEDNGGRDKKVRVARDLGTRVEVDTGIRAGDQVILYPPVNLVDGSKVQVRTEAAASNR